MKADNDEHASLRVEARAWLVRMRNGDASEAVVADFEQWYAQSPLNKAAYEREAADYRAMSDIKISAEFGSDGRWRRPASTTWLKFGAIAAAIVAVLFVIMAGTRPGPFAQQGTPRIALGFEPLSTRRGEIRVFRLSDGSVATLDTDSMIEVSITQERRFLRLAQGRARFKVVAGPRPFTVQAGAGQVIADASTFDLALDAEDRVAVYLLEGSALVRPSAHYADLSSRDHALRIDTAFVYFGDDFATATGANHKPTGSKDWPSGWVEHEEIRLDELIAQANDYSVKPIRFADPSLGALRMTGRFKINDTSGLVARICEMFDLRAVAEHDAVYLRRK